MNNQDQWNVSFFSSNALPELLLLTPREKEVLSLIVLGYTAKRAARTLGISFRTVEAHIEKLKYKLRCSTKGEVVGKLMQAFLGQSAPQEF